MTGPPPTLIPALVLVLALLGGLGELAFNAPWAAWWLHVQLAVGPQP